MHESQAELQPLMRSEELAEHPVYPIIHMIRAVGYLPAFGGRHRLTFFSGHCGALLRLHLLTMLIEHPFLALHRCSRLITYYIVLC